MDPNLVLLAFEAPPMGTESPMETLLMGRSMNLTPASSPKMWRVFSRQQSTSLAAQLTCMTALAILGVVANGLVAFTLIRRRQLKYPSNRLVLSLCTSGLLFSVLSLPLCIARTLATSKSDLSPDILCTLTALSSTLASASSTPVVGLIALDRFVAIARPMVYTHLITPARASLLAATVWLLATVATLMPVVGVINVDQDACQVDWREKALFAAPFGALFVIAPALTMLYCYTVILRVALKKCRSVNSHLMVGDSSDRILLCRERLRVKRSQTLHGLGDREPGILIPITKAASDNELADKKEEKRCNNENAATKDRRKPTSMSVKSIARSVSSSKRPSFTWIQYNSPTKGLLTIALLLGSFLLTWLPFVLNMFYALPRLAFWSVSIGFVLNPMLYGLMNRAIRLEVVPALCPPRNKALKGLPSKSTSRRVSAEGHDVPHRLGFSWRSRTQPSSPQLASRPTKTSLSMTSLKMDNINENSNENNNNNDSDNGDQGIPINIRRQTSMS